MLKSLVKTTGLIAGLVFSGAVYALGMGGINVTSALGQPLRAEIDLLSVSKSDKAGLSARLASADSFQMAGIDYPYSLPKITFKIKTRKDGTTYVTLSTADPINDPFVNLLVELDWPTGKLMREYTFLLDPPGYKLQQPKPETVHPVTPTATERKYQEEWAAKTKSEPKPAPQPIPAAAPAVKTKSLPASKPSAKPAAAGNVSAGTITVKRGDTLSKIAAQIKEPDVTLEQMLVALYRANANQFDGKNMNRIRAGKILRRPTDSDLAHLSNSEAVKVIRAQAADWHAYRQKLAAASSTMSEQAPQQQVSGKISTSVSDKAPAAKASAKEVLRLSKGEAPGDKVAANGNNVKSLQNKIHSLEEEAVARNKELQDSKQRIAMLEKNIKEMKHLVDLKAQPAPAATPGEAQTKPESAKIVPPPATTAASGVAAASAEKAAKPAAKPQPAAKPKPKPKAAPKLVLPPPQPSLLDEVMGNPLYLGGIAAAILALGGLGFFAVRRRGSGGQQKDIQSALAEQAEEAGHISEPVESSPETGDFTHMEGAEEETAGVESESAAEDEEVDPISEAELFLNFGRYAQAEEVLKEALSRDPNNLKYLLKLLGIYASDKDVNAFSSFARRVQDSGDAEAWEKVAAMGRDIDPSNPMYGGTGEAGVAAEEAEATEGTGETAAATDFVLDEGKNDAASALDFDLGMGTPEEEAAPEVESEPQETADNESTTILSQDDMRAAQEAPMDFDITSTNPSMTAAEPAEAATEEPAKDEDAGLDFDITSTNPSMTALEPEESSTIDITAEEEKPADAGLNLDDLIFDVTGSHATEETSEAEEEPETTEAASAPMDIGLGDINLNLGAAEPEQPAAAEAPAEPAGDKDEHWHEVATKLDLAKAYQEMGDADGAREILQEVVRDGDDQQRETAQTLIDQLA